MPSNEIIAGYQCAPLILASVSRAWCQIATNYPPLWSTILIDQSEDDYLERIQLFLDRSGKEHLDIILLDHTTPTLRLSHFLAKYADRFRTIAGLADEVRFNHYSFRMEPHEAPADFINWGIYTSKPRRVSTVPIPKRLRGVQFHQSHFDSTSLIQFTHFHNLESLSISVAPDPIPTEWHTTLRFELLRHLRLDISHVEWSDGSNAGSLWIEWLECPVLVDLDLHYKPTKYPFKETDIRLEASLLRFRSLQNLRVHTGRQTGGLSDASEYPRIPATFDGRLELLQLTVDTFPSSRKVWGVPFIERLFSIFVPSTHLAWPYGQFPSPTIFHNLKTMHIQYLMEGDGGAYVLGASQVSQLEFPFLEELYLQYKAPRLLHLLRAPRLISLRIDGFTPSDLRHISNNTLFSIRLKINEYQPDSQGIYLPSADKLRLDLEVLHLFHLNIHPSFVQSITINTDWQEETLLPPNWVADYVLDMLGTVTNLKVTPLLSTGFGDQLLRPSQTIPSFLKPFVYLQHLTLSWEILGQCPCIDQFAQHLPDPDFLPELEVLSISEYPSWPDFFQNIQKRQIGHLTGQFRTGLKQVTIKGPIHGALLEHLRESLAGKYIGLSDIPPCRGGCEKWAVLPFEHRGSGTKTLCCYVCHRAGLELGCTILPSQDMVAVAVCSRHPQLFMDWPSNTVFAP